MNERLKLKSLPIKKGIKKSIPLFYHFIYCNELEPGNPFEYTEFSDQTQSLVHFRRPEKPVSKIIDYSK